MLDLNNILEDIKEIVKNVGKLQIKKRSNIEKFSKGTDDIVTNVDLESEKIIIQTLNKYKLNILSEEVGYIDNSSEYTFIIDPLDGTKNYADMKNEFAISIALMHKNEIILGVVYVPPKKELFYAIKGKGAYLNDNKLEVSNISDIKLATIPVSYNINLFVNKNNIKEIPMGSLSYRLCTIASSKTDFSVVHKTKLWDIAAAVIIIQEAQGDVLDFSLEQYQFSITSDWLTNIIFSNKSLNKEIIKLI